MPWPKPAFCARDLPLGPRSSQTRAGRPGASTRSFRSPGHTIVLLVGNGRADAVGSVRVVQFPEHLNDEFFTTGTPFWHVSVCSRLYFEIPGDVQTVSEIFRIYNILYCIIYTYSKLQNCWTRLSPMCTNGFACGAVCRFAKRVWD